MASAEPGGTGTLGALNKAKLASNGGKHVQMATIERVVRKYGSGTTSTFTGFLWRAFKTEVEPGIARAGVTRISF